MMMVNGKNGLGCNGMPQLVTEIGSKAEGLIAPTSIMHSWLPISIMKVEVQIADSVWLGAPGDHQGLKATD